MSDERTRAADEMKQWRVRHAAHLTATEASFSLQAEQSLRSSVGPAGDVVGSGHEGYPLDADEPC